MAKRISAFLFLLTFTAHADVSSQVRDWFFEIENDPATQTKKILNAKERQQLFDYVVNHKVAKISKENTKKYDPTGFIGYCYGRAMAVHLRARRMGLKPDAIRKLFIVGDLRQGEKPEWRFHVTTLVRGESGWYAVDPILKRPYFKGTALPMKEWVKTIKNVWGASERAPFLYRVSAESVVPDIRVFLHETKETGKGIIEYKFEPAKAAGLKLSVEEEIEYYDLDEAAQDRLFLRAKDSFDFASLIMDEITATMGTLHHDFSYNGYFYDLLEDIRVAKYNPNRVSERKLFSETPKVDGVQHDLGSFKFYRVKP